MCFDYAIRSEKGHHWLQNGMALSFLLTLAGTINGCSEVVNKHASHPNVIAMWSVHSSDRKTFDSQKYVQNIKESKLDNPLDGEWTMVDIKSDNGKENVVAVEKKLTNNREPTMFLTHKERRKNFGATMFSKSPKLFFSADSSFPENIYIQKHLALTNKPHTPKIKITHTNNLISEHSVSLQDKTLRHSKHHNLAVNQKNYTNENKFGTYISKKENPKVENSKFESSISTNNFLGFIKMADKHKNRTSEISTVKKDKAHFGNNYENEIKLTPIRHRQRHLFKKSPPDYIGNLNENWRTLTIPAGSQSPKGRDAFSPKDKFLILFGQIEEEIMRQTRICGSHTSVNLLDTYNLLELSYPSNYNRVVIFYINVISITKGKIDLSLRRVKSIIDNFLASNNVITIMNLYPENEQLIYKTLQIRQSEITELILNMNDEILEYCDHYSPTCIAENSLGQVFWALHQTHKLDANYQLKNLQYFEKRFCSPTFTCEPNLNENASPNAMFKTQRDQLKDVAEALCLLPHHRIVEFVLNESETASNVYDEFGREIGDGQSSDKRAITQTGLLLKDILPLDLKYYDKNRPPKFEGQPTVVYFHVTVLSIDSISEDSMTYVADIFLAQSWRDHRLRLPGNMTEEYRILDVEWLHDIWRPDCFFKNAKQVTFHEMSVPNHYLWLYHDKTLLYMAKLTLVLSCAMKFETYPHDTQICSMMIESLSHTTHDLVFKWNETDPLVMNSDIELPQLDISRNTTEDCTLTYSTGNFTCLAVVFNLRRRLGYHLFHTYIPSAITVVMSWISFWIKPEAIPARVTLGVTSLLTLATQNQQSQSSLPPVSYIKAIDVWMSSCTVFVFASLLEFGLVNHFMNSEPIGKDMTGYSMEDLTDFDDRKLSDVSGGLNSFNSRSKSRLGSHSYRLRSRSPGQPQYVVTRCTGKDIAIYIDKFSRIFFPVSFCILNISYWTTYGNL